jgi:tol-pal system beta propeller repeat protein TolB
MNNNFKKFIIAIAIFYNPLYAMDFTIDILNPKYKPKNILFLTPKTADSFSERNFNKIKEIIAQDLFNSGAFEIFEEELFSNINYNFILEATITEVEIDGDDKYLVVIDLKDASANKSLMKNKYAISVKEFKKYHSIIAHEIADSIYKSSLGLNGYFSNSLIYVQDEKKLMMADYDGKNEELILTSKGKILAPTLSQNGRYLAYVDFIEGFSKIRIYDFETKEIYILGDFIGLTLSPRYSKDGNFLIFTVLYDGYNTLIEVNLAQNTYKKVLSNTNINLVGGYSVDNNLLLLNSDANKYPSIYIINKKTKETKKISKGYGSYYTPVFSNNSNVILFTKIHNRKFYIGLLNLASQERIVSSNTEVFVESPNWLPDDRHIIYQVAYDTSKYKKLYEFYLMDIISGKKIIINPAKDILFPVISKGIIKKENKNIVEKIKYML